MPSFASQQTLDALGLPLSSLQETLRAFQVPFGRPEDLAAFPRRLARDEPLQNALAALIRARQQTSPRGTDAAANRLSLHQALDSLLYVVGGAPTPDLTANATLHETVDLLISFLISLEGWSSAEMREAITPPFAPKIGDDRPDPSGESPEKNQPDRNSPDRNSPDRNRPDQNRPDQNGLRPDVAAFAEARRDPTPEEQRSPDQISQEQLDDEELARLLQESSWAAGAASPASGADAIEGAPAGEGGTPALGNLAQLLTRLELTNLELRLQLESIDARLNRMEPRLESIPRAQAEAASVTTPEAQLPVPRHRGDHPRYTTAAAFSAIPLSPEPSPFAGEAGADLTSVAEAARPAGPAGPAGFPAAAPPVSTGAAPRPVVLRYAAESSQSSDAPFQTATSAPASIPAQSAAAQTPAQTPAQTAAETTTQTVVYTDLSPKEVAPFSASALSSAPAAVSELLPATEPLPVAPVPQTKLSAASPPAPIPPASPSTSSDPEPKLNSRSVSDPALTQPPAQRPAQRPAQSLAQLAPPLAELPPAPSRLSEAAAAPEPGAREPRFFPATNPASSPGKRSRVTSLRLSEPSSASPAGAGQTRSGAAEPIADPEDPAPASDRRRRWRAILIVLLLLLLAAGALAAFLFLGNPETTTFRGAVAPPLSRWRIS